MEKMTLLWSCKHSYWCDLWGAEYVDAVRGHLWLMVMSKKFERLLVL